MPYKNASLERLKKHYNFLWLLSKAKTKKKRQELLDIASAEQIKTICECVKNVMLGNVPGIRKQDIREFKKNREIIRKLISTGKNVTSKKKKELLMQQGGFLPALLAPVIGIAGTLIADLIKNNI